MLPEPTIPKPPATLSAVSGPWVMTPLFCVPDHPGADSIPPRPSRRRTSTTRRTSRRAAARPNSGPGATAEGQETEDLLAVTAERLRQALWRSFLRYGVQGDLEATVHAAMNVIEPVLLAHDTEIQRLLLLIPVKPATGRAATGRAATGRAATGRAVGGRRAKAAPAVAAAAEASLV